MFWVPICMMQGFLTEPSVMAFEDHLLVFNRNWTVIQLIKIFHNTYLKLFIFYNLIACFQYLSMLIIQSKNIIVKDASIIVLNRVCLWLSWGVRFWICCIIESFLFIKTRCSDVSELGQLPISDLCPCLIWFFVKTGKLHSRFGSGPLVGLHLVKSICPMDRDVAETMPIARNGYIVVRLLFSQFHLALN